MNSYDELTAIADPSLEDTLNEIKSDVSQWRELNALSDLDRQFISSDELEQKLIEEIEEEDIEELAVTQEILVLLDLMEEDQDLYQIFLNMYSEGVAGFYDDETDKIYIIGDSEILSPSEEKAYAHEYTHALQDQHFDLGSLGLDNEGNSDMSLAILSLVEGDASLLEEYYYWYVFDDAKREAYAQEMAEYDVEALIESIPEVILQEFIFPYTAGINFVYTLYKDGGWDAVNDAYSDLPQSTEQIIHPEKYLERDEPQNVVIPDLQSALGGTWTQLDTNVLGELYMILYLEAFMDIDQAKEAAEGWDGDRFAYLKDAEGRKLLVLSSVWDSIDDAREFFDAYTDFTEARSGSTWDSLRDDVRIKWWQTEGSSVYLEQKRENVIIILAPDKASTEAVLGEFTLFGPTGFDWFAVIYISLAGVGLALFLASAFWFKRRT